MLYKLRGRSGGVGKGVFQAEFFVFVEGEGVVGEDFDFFYGFKGVDEGFGGNEFFVGIGETGDEDVADPKVDSLIAKIGTAVKNVFVGMAGEFFMFFVIDFFDVEKDCVGDFYEAVEFTEEGFFSCKGLCGGVKTGGYAHGFGFFKKVYDEVYLYQRISAAYGYAALFAPVFAVSNSILKNFVCGPHISACEIPGIGIVAIAASHIAAFEEYYISYSGTIYRSEGFNAVDRAFDCFCHMFFLHLR